LEASCAAGAQIFVVVIKCPVLVALFTIHMDPSRTIITGDPNVLGVPVFTLVINVITIGAILILGVLQSTGIAKYNGPI